MKSTNTSLLKPGLFLETNTAMQKASGINIYFNRSAHHRRSQAQRRVQTLEQACIQVLNFLFSQDLNNQQGMSECFHLLFCCSQSPSKRENKFSNGHSCRETMFSFFKSGTNTHTKPHTQQWSGSYASLNKLTGETPSHKTDT